ncbi:hypothetical protein ACP4OV_012471 [Aristida adscensionis]
MISQTTRDGLNKLRNQIKLPRAASHAEAVPICSLCLTEKYSGFQDDKMEGFVTLI